VPQRSPRQQVRRVLLITLVLNFVVAFGKIILGLLTGALAITADGFHSLVDGTSNLVGLVAIVIADRPPDDDHPYGHRRFETMAALLIGALLLLTAWEVVQGAIERLQDGTLPEITPLTFAVLIGTLAVNLFVSTYERREGKRLNSEILIADSANTGADVFVTLSVIASMALVTLGLYWVDTVAALVVVVLIGRAGWQILRQTGSVLVDTAPYPPGQLTALVEEVPCVENVLRARSRGPLDAATIDIDVQVAPEMTANQTANIAQAIQDHLDRSLGGIAEVEVHFVPRQDGKPDYALMARACGDALGLTTHEVHVTDLDTNINDKKAPGKLLELHVEVPPGHTNRLVN
jgi:cation diffusion facilitator family transporter